MRRLLPALPPTVPALAAELPLLLTGITLFRAIPRLLCRALSRGRGRQFLLSRSWKENSGRLARQDAARLRFLAQSAAIDYARKDIGRLQGGTGWLSRGSPFADWIVQNLGRLASIAVGFGNSTQLHAGRAHLAPFYAGGRAGHCGKVCR